MLSVLSWQIFRITCSYGRSRQILYPTLLQVNKATVNMMRRVEPYIAWGYPNLKTVRELVYKRGYGKVNKDRIPLTDNTVVEKVRPASSLLSRLGFIPPSEQREDGRGPTYVTSPLVVMMMRSRRMQS